LKINHLAALIHTTAADPNLLSHHLGWNKEINLIKSKTRLMLVVIVRSTSENLIHQLRRFQKQVEAFFFCRNIATQTIQEGGMIVAQFFKQKSS
jgi:hypothetical protein